jgi:hypothetical protein
VAVEFALVLPLLVMLLMGTITGGLTYFDKISIADAARESARFGATADVVKTPNWASEVRKRVFSAATGVLGTDSAPATGAHVCVQLYKGGLATLSAGCDGSTPAPSSSAPLSGLSCVVRVYTRKPGNLDIGLKSWTLSLTQDAYARYERAC